MANVIGRLMDVGIAVEGTRGTAETATHWIGTLDKDFDDKASFVKNESSYGTVLKDSNMALTREWAEGSISGKVGLDSIGVLLTSVCGASPSSAESSGEYTHTWYHTDSATNKSLTISYKDANQDLDFAGAMINSFTLNWELEQYLNFEAQFMSLKSASGSNTPSYSEEVEFHPSHSIIKLASAQSGLDAAQAIGLRSASVTFNKNAKGKEQLGSTTYADIHNGTVEVTGTMEVYYDGSTYKDLVFNETEQAVRLSVVNTAETLANSSNPSLTVDLYECRFSDFERSMGNDDIVTETVTFTAQVDFANSMRAFKIDLLNGTAGSLYA